MGRDDEKPETLLTNSSRRSWSAPEPGQRLANGRFEISRRLGDGGMGIVYEAFDAERREKVALKTLQHLEPAGIYQLKSEFRVLADVSHPNLVRLHELFADDQTWFFTMDLVDGVQFDAWVAELRRRPPSNLSELCDSPWLEALRAALAQLVEAVAALHAFGKLHRDLKPSNVMLTHGGQVVVLDFGLTVAPAAEGPLDGELEGAFSGTPAYMAPEQVLGLKVSPASDWYALGVMLFQALTGSLPFQGSFHEIATQKQLRRAPRVTAAFPDVPEDLARICERLLATDPAARPDGATMLAEFGLRPSPASNRPPPSSRPPRSGAGGPPMIGREPELADIMAAYAVSVTAREPVIVMIEGESGIGKTTLVARFTELLRRDTDAVVLSGRCYERETVPFNAFDVVVDDLSRYLCELPKAEAARLAPAEAWALVRLFPVLGRVAAFANVEAHVGADPQEVRRRGFVALGELFSRMRDQAPLVLIIDDLQWSDADSIRLLLHLMRQAHAPGLLFVGTRRDVSYPVLEPLYDKLSSDIRVDFRECKLAPLAPDVAVQVIGRDAPAEVLHEARGNPFLLNELLRYARDRGAEDLGNHSLNEMLWQRCAELPLDSQRLLHAIALSAVSVPLALVVRAAGVEPNAHDALRDRQLVRRGTREGEVECYHDKIRETVEAAFSEAETRARHRSLAAAWEAAKDPDPELLALHHAGAGEHQRAAEHWVEAAERSARSFGFERAVELYGRALEQGCFDAETLHRLRIARADVLAQSGRSLEAAETCTGAMSGASARHRSDLTRRAGGFYLQCGRLEEAIPLVNQGLAPFGLSVARSNAAAVIGLLWERTRLRLRGYEPRAQPPDPGAAERFRAAEVITGALPSLDPIRYPALATRLLLIALDSGDPVLLARAMANELLVGLMLALPDAKLREIAARAEALCDRTGDPMARLWLDQSLATLELSDNPRLSLTHLDRARELLRAHPTPVVAHLAVWLEWSRLQILCLGGDFDEVARSTPALLDDAWARDNRGVVPFLSGVPGAVARVAVEDLVDLRRDLDRSRTAWHKPSFTWQDIMQTQGEVLLAAYEGDMGPALAVTELLENKLSKSLARHAASVRGYVGYVSSWTSLGRARRLPHGPERARLLERASASLRFGHSKRLAAAWSSPLEPAVEVLRGNTEAAVAMLRALVADESASERLPVYAVCARRGLGALLGGDEGAALVREADRFLKTHGVVDPERFVAAVAPGLTGG